MMGERVVIGAGPDALRAAAVLATAGHQVSLLQARSTPSGLLHPELPQSTGRMQSDNQVRELAEQILGSLVEAPGISRGLTLGGALTWLPMRRRDLASLVPFPRAWSLGRGWLDARKGVAKVDLVPGGGQEERTYRDWVVRRFGAPAYHALFQAWAGARFGQVADELGATVARAHHAWRDEGPHQVPGGRYDVALGLAEDAVLQAGGRIFTDSMVDHLEFASGRVCAVALGDGSSMAVDGPLWLARSPGTVVSWLPADVAAPVLRDALALPAASLQIVCLKGEVDGLPEELHVLDADAPFWAVVSPYGIKEYALFMSTLPAGRPAPDDAGLVQQTAAAASRLGVGEFHPEGARIERIPEHQPVWTVGAHARLHRIINLYETLGLVAVGRTGTFSEIDPGTELRLATRYRDGDGTGQRDALRELVEPPVRLDDLRVSLRRFIER